MSQYSIENIFQYSEDDLDNFLNNQGIDSKSFSNIREKRYVTIYQLAQKNLMIQDAYLSDPHIQDNILKSNNWEEFKRLSNSNNILIPQIVSHAPSVYQTLSKSAVTTIIGNNFIIIDGEKYISTSKSFINYANIYKYYNWIIPQKDNNHAEYFYFLFGDGSDKSKNIKITANKTMLGNIQVDTKQHYDSTDNDEGETTFIIDETKIPIGSKFKWNDSGHCWIYKNSKNDNYYKIELKLDNFIYTFNTLIENKVSDDKLTEFRLIEKANNNALHAALLLKQKLVEHSLNVVTAESLTAGMLAKILVDIPLNGAAIYGGFVVYDTDAKRQFLGVKTEGVYTHATAEQMAYGALKNSRAMVSIAVTGNAMPYPEDAEHMGDVYIGVGFKYRSGDQSEFTVISEHFNFCERIPKLCNDWKFLHSRKDANGYNVYAPIQLTSFIADFVRLSTVQEACLMCIKYINQLDAANQMVNLKSVPLKSWDKVCKPSGILGKHINATSDQISSARWCNDYDQNNINM